jgi:nitrogen fixation protein FixH
MIVSPPPNRKSLIPAHILWPGIVVGLLGLSLAICIATVVLATGDPSVAVEPAYYERALAWDVRQGEQAASDALGWRCDILIDVHADLVGGRTVTVALEDAAGPVVGATVGIEAFANARASQRYQLDMTPAGAGRYEATLPAPRSGLWTLSVRAQRGQDVLTITDRLTVEPPERSR